MVGFLFAFIACFLAGFGARDQVLVAALTERLGRRRSLLIVAVACGALASGIAAYFAIEIGAMTNHRGNLVLACFALAAGGIESLIIAPSKRAKEPTRSLFAAMLVLLFSQIADAARFLVLAIALASDALIPAAVGGAVGGGAALLVGWLGAGPLLEASGGLRVVRRWAGGILLAVALGLAVWEFAIIGAA